MNTQLGAVNPLAIATVSIAVIIGGAVFLIGTKTQLQPPQPSSQLAASATQTTSSKDVIWQHYSNSRYKLAFTYPQNWKITEGFVGEDRYLITMTDPSQLTNASLLISGNTSVDKQASAFTSSPGITVLANENTTVAGHTARMVRYKSPDGITGRFYLVDANSYIYKLPTIYESGDPKPIWFILSDISQTLFNSYNFDGK